MSHLIEAEETWSSKKSSDQNVFQHNSPLNQNYLKRMDRWQDAGSPIKHRKFKCMDLVTIQPKKPNESGCYPTKTMMDPDYDIVKAKMG